MAVTFHSETREPVSLRKVVSDIQNEINAIPDISETTITGGRKRQFQVFLDEAKLRERFLNPLEVSDLIRRANVKAAAGTWRVYRS